MTRTVTCLVGFALVSAGTFTGGSAARGQCIDSEFQKLLADDGAAGDSFGVRVSISGNAAIVGAFLDDDNGTDSGAAYIFRFDGTTWNQEAMLLASDGSAGDFFGDGVAISGDVAVIGSPNDDDLGTNSGSAYIFTYDPMAKTWSQTAKLRASDGAAFDLFGDIVSLSNGVAIIVAPFDDNGNGLSAGAAYVYRGSGANWGQEAKLIPSDTIAFERPTFTAISPDASRVLFGSFFHDHLGTDSGSAYIFFYNPTTMTWSQEAELLASDGAAGDQFGFGVSLSNDVAIVGAWLDDNPGGTDAGAAYVFRRTGTTWIQEAKLLAADGMSGDEFGVSVALSNTIAVIGAMADDDNGIDAGSGYIFGFDSTTWNQQGKFLPTDGQAGDKFGNTVAIFGTNAIIGADVGDGLVMDSGSAYIFSNINDCNMNAVLDNCDIAAGTSQDCNGNGTPDECEIDVNSSAPGGPFFCTVNCDPDCNNNGIPDGCDLDCNANGVPDDCDIAAGTSLDCNSNTIPDECEADCNANGIPDDCDITAGTSPDCNSNGIPDECDTASGTSMDCNGDAVPDECQIVNGCVLAVWTGGGATSNWSEAANWCPAVVPGSAANGTNFIVIIGPAAIVSLDIDATVCSAALDPTATINVDNAVGRTLTVLEAGGGLALGATAVLNIQNNNNRVEAGGMIANNGSINIIANQGTADLVPSAAGSMLSGTGEVRLFNPATSRLGSLSGLVSLTNDTGHLVCGAGEVLGEFSNNGAVLADMANNALTMKGIGTVRTNNSTMTATNGGELRVAGQLDQGMTGVLCVDAIGSTLRLGDTGLEDATVFGGTISQIAGQILLGNNARLRDVTINGIVAVPGEPDASFVEGQITNNGTINLSGSGALVSTLSTFTLAGPGMGTVMFDGPGKIEMRNDTRAVLDSFGPFFPVITNGAAHTIEGIGIIRANFINNGRIVANLIAAGSTLVMTPASGTMLDEKTNNGTLEATFFATLAVQAPVTNDGLMTATNSGTVRVEDDITGNGTILADGGTIRLSPGAGTASLAGSTLDVMNGGLTELEGSATVNLTGNAMITGGGTFQGAVGSSGALNAAGATIMSDPAGCGIMIISDSMSLNLSTDLAIIGSPGPVPPPFGCIPPILRITNTANATVGGDFLMSGGVQVEVQPTTSFSLAGNFDNQSDNPLLVDWANGPLTLNGPGGAGGMQIFETGGENRGVNLSAFINNFAMGTLRVEAGAFVDFVDAFDNIPGAGCEVLYTHTLSLGAGSTIRLNGCNIFYETLIDEGATIDVSMGGALVCFNPGDIDCNGLADVNDIPVFVAVLLGQDTDPVHVAASDLSGDGAAGGQDIQPLVDTLLGM